MAMRERWRMRERQMPWSINAFAALAGEIILQDSVYQQKTWQWLAEEGSALPSAAPRSRSDGLSRQANYLFLRCDCRIWICNT